MTGTLAFLSIARQPPRRLCRIGRVRDELWAPVLVRLRPATAPTNNEGSGLMSALRSPITSVVMVAASCAAASAEAAPVQWKVADGGNGHSYEAVLAPAG